MCGVQLFNVQSQTVFNIPQLQGVHRSYLEFRQSIENNRRTRGRRNNDNL